MKRLAARLLTRLVRRFQAVLSRLHGRGRGGRPREEDRRVRLLLAPLEGRDSTGNLLGGLVGAALGYRFADPLDQPAGAGGFVGGADGMAFVTGPTAAPDSTGGPRLAKSPGSSPSAPPLPPPGARALPRPARGRGWAGRGNAPGVGCRHGRVGWGATASAY